MKKLTTLSLIALFMMGVFSSCDKNKAEVKPEPKQPEPPKAVNVIYMIVDGMALPQVYGAMYASGQGLTFSQFP